MKCYQDTSGAAEDKDSQDAKDDDDNLDFEEISDGELEEERTRGILLENLSARCFLTAEVITQVNENPV